MSVYTENPEAKEDSRMKMIKNAKKLFLGKFITNIYLSLNEILPKRS